MCDVCKVEGLDPKFVNGEKSIANASKLYRVFKDKVADIRLCHVHSIELFLIGEKRFVHEHIAFAKSLVKKTKKSDSLDSLFG